MGKLLHLQFVEFENSNNKIDMNEAIRQDVKESL